MSASWATSMVSTKEAWTQRSSPGSLAEYTVPAGDPDVAFAAGRTPETGRCSPVDAPGDALGLLGRAEADDRDPANRPLEASVRVRPVGAVLDRPLRDQRIRRLEQQRAPGGEQQPRLPHHHPGHRVRAEEAWVRRRVTQRERACRTQALGRVRTRRTALGSGIPSIGQGSPSGDKGTRRSSAARCARGSPPSVAMRRR